MGTQGNQGGISQNLTSGGAKSREGHVVIGIKCNRDELPIQFEIETTIASESNEKVHTKVNEKVSSPKSILKEWNEATYSPTMSARKSWADEMESENKVRRKP